METTRKVLLVGATGFLGSKILNHLEQDETVSVRAVSRRGAPGGAGGRVEWVRGDMLDPASLDERSTGRTSSSVQQMAT